MINKEKLEQELSKEEEAMNNFLAKKQEKKVIKEKDGLIERVDKTYITVEGKELLND